MLTALSAAVTSSEEKRGDTMDFIFVAFHRIRCSSVQILWPKPGNNNPGLGISQSVTSHSALQISVAKQQTQVTD